MDGHAFPYPSWGSLKKVLVSSHGGRGLLFPESSSGERCQTGRACDQPEARDPDCLVQPVSLEGRSGNDAEEVEERGCHNHAHQEERWHDA